LWEQHVVAYEYHRSIITEDGHCLHISTYVAGSMVLTAIFFGP
jgi:hypothetical protein